MEELGVGLSKSDIEFLRLGLQRNAYGKSEVHKAKTIVIIVIHFQAKNY